MVSYSLRAENHEQTFMRLKFTQRRKENLPTLKERLRAVTLRVCVKYVCSLS